MIETKTGGMADISQNTETDTETDTETEADRDTYICKDTTEIASSFVQLHCFFRFATLNSQPIDTCRTDSNRAH